MKSAIIVGSNGQDGRLLFELLGKKGYTVIGISRDSDADITKKENVFDLIKTHKPDEIYYLAAYHNSSEDDYPENVKLFEKSYEVNVRALIYFLEAIRLSSPGTRIFYASSSHIFKGSNTEVQDESTPINPTCIYGITKSSGMFACRFYKNNYNIFASTGILYNHESSLRNEKFVSKKIIKGAINIKNKKQDKIFLGNLKAEIDWGYAPDYVDAMHRILNIEKPDEFIISTGQKHMVQDFVEIVFSYLDLDWRLYIKENSSIIKGQKVSLLGNPEKLMKMTGWRPSANFEQMIKILLEEESGNFQEN